jgi:hypothetical protein
MCVSAVLCMLPQLHATCRLREDLARSPRGVACRQEPCRCLPGEQRVCDDTTSSYSDYVSQVNSLAEVLRSNRECRER